MNRLDGKVALITGAAQGIGAACVRALHAEGARVIATDVRADLLAKLGDELGEDRVLPLTLDVADADAWASVVKAGTARFGGIGVLVNNAGIIRRAGLLDCTEEEYREVVEVNQLGPFHGMRAVAEGMKAAGGGSIVNVSSVAALGGMPGAIAYGATKWAVRGMTRSAAVELGGFNIRVNAVFPGPIRTPMMDGYPEDAFAFLPLPRFGRPEEVATVVTYLASDESSYVTGAEHVVDGGLTGMNPGAHRGR